MASRSRRRLPAQSPAGYQRPRRLPIHPLVLLVILVIGFGAVIIGGIYTITARTVTLNIGGVRQDVRTHASTVGGMLGELQVLIEPQDTVSPSPDTPILNGLLITIDKAFPVVLDVDGQLHTVRTHRVQPQDILNEAGVTTGSHDLILVDNVKLKADPYTTPPQVIAVMHAVAVTIDDDGVSSTVYTVHQTVGEALHDAGIALYLADSVTPDLSAVLSDRSTISIRRSVSVTVIVDGRTLATRTHGKTVGAVLAEAGIALVGLDYVTPDESTAVTSGMTIRVSRVTEEDYIERVPIDFKHVTRSDPTLPLDTRKVIQQGVPGVIEQHTLIRREDGVEVSRSAPQSAISQTPQDEITAVGTNPVIKSLDTPEGPVQYWRLLTMKATSYKPSSTGKSPDDPLYGITATGAKLYRGIVAVDPQVIPLGTNVYIPGYGLAVAGDTGGGVKGLMIDLGYGDDDYQEWSKTVEVYLLAPAPSPDQIPLLPEETQ